MKIAIVSQAIDTVLPPYQNSVGACTYGLACALGGQAEVTVFGAQNKHNQEPELREGNVRFRLMPTTRRDEKLFQFRSKAAQILHIRTPISTWNWLFRDYGRQIAEELAKERWDVIHVQHSSQYVPVIQQLNPSAKVVLHLHAELFSQTQPPRLQKRLENASLITSVSDYITAKLKRDIPALSQKFETTYNGINAAEFAREPNGHKSRSGLKRIMYAGGISPHKGLHVLLEAARIVAEQYPNFVVDIIGPIGSYPLQETFDLTHDKSIIAGVKQYYSSGLLPVIAKRFSRTRDTSDRYLSCLKQQLSDTLVGKVNFLGLIPRPELVQRYYDADLFVFPPIWDEGFGIPPVEAMAAGTAVVATRSGAVVETVQHEKTGLLVEKNNPRALAEEMLTLLKNDNLRAQFGSNGRQRALTHFTWDSVGAHVIQRYQTLCDQPSGHISQRSPVTVVA